MNRFSLIILLLIVGITSHGQIDTTRVYELNEVVTTSQSRSNLVTPGTRPITVITRNEIASLPVQDLNDLLNYLPGVDIRARGVNGVQADISMRGGTFDQVLILINGINVTDPHTGHMNLNIPIDLNMIDRIEVLQGTALSVFGLSAFSGAINIIIGEQYQEIVKASLVAGQYGYFAPSVGVKYNTGRWNFIGQLDTKQSTGYIDNTDFQTYNLFLLSSYKNEKTGDFELQVGGQLKDFGSNSFYSLKYPNQFEATKTLVSSLKWNKQVSDFNMEAAAYYRVNQDRYELFRSYQEAPAWYTTHNHHISQVGGGFLKGAWYSSVGKTAAGVELRQESIVSNVLGDVMENSKPVPGQPDSVQFTHSKSRFNVNYFIEQTFIYKKFSATICASGHYNTMFKNNFAFGANVGYEFAKGGNIYANVNRALRLPTFTDLYYQSATQIANPNLMPETSLTTEVGISWANYGFNTSLNVYYRMGENIIDWVKSPEEEKWRSVNHTNINALGGELSVGYHYGYWLKNLMLNYSYCNLTKMEEENVMSKYALDYLKHKVTLTLEHGIWKGFGASWQFNFQQREGVYTTIEGTVQNYTPVYLLDGRIFWQNEAMKVYVEASNLLNQQYYDYGGIQQPGIWCKAGIALDINLKKKNR